LCAGVHFGPLHVNVHARSQPSVIARVCIDLPGLGCQTLERYSHAAPGPIRSRGVPPQSASTVHGGPCADLIHTAQISRPPTPSPSARLRATRRPRLALRYSARSRQAPHTTGSHHGAGMCSAACSAGRGPQRDYPETGSGAECVGAAYIGVGWWAPSATDVGWGCGVTPLRTRWSPSAPQHRPAITAAPPRCGARQTRAPVQSPSGRRRAQRQDAHRPWPVLALGRPIAGPSFAASTVLQLDRSRRDEALGASSPSCNFSLSIV
jgi:hypothetical protein